MSATRGAKASAATPTHKLVWVAADAPLSLPGLTPAFDQSTLGPFEPDHHRDESGNERQTGNKNKSGCHVRTLLLPLHTQCPHPEILIGGCVGVAYHARRRPALGAHRRPLVCTALRGCGVDRECVHATQKPQPIWRPRESGRVRRQR